MLIKIVCTFTVNGRLSLLITVHNSYDRYKQRKMKYNRFFFIVHANVLRIATLRKLLRF